MNRASQESENRSKLVRPETCNGRVVRQRLDCLKSSDQGYKELSVGKPAETYTADSTSSSCSAAWKRQLSTASLQREALRLRTDCLSNSRTFTSSEFGKVYMARAIRPRSLRSSQRWGKPITSKLYIAQAERCRQAKEGRFYQSQIRKDSA